MICEGHEDSMNCSAILNSKILLLLEQTEICFSGI